MTDDAKYCDRHVNKTITLYIPVYGHESIIIDSVYKHRPRDFYKSIICPSCRYEQEHSDHSTQYFDLKLKNLKKKSITTKERLQKLLKTRKNKKESNCENDYNCSI